MFKFIYRFVISNVWMGFIHSPIQYGKHILLKRFLLDGIHFNLTDDTDLKR